MSSGPIQRGGGGSVSADALRQENGAGQFGEKCCSRVRWASNKLTRSPPALHLPAWLFDGRPAAAGNTDADFKVCAIRIRAEKRVGELLKELARATPADAGAIGGNAKGGNFASPVAGTASAYAQALTENKRCAAAPPERRRAAGTHQGHPRRDSRGLRLAAHLEGTTGQRHPRGQAARPEAHAAARHTRQGQTPIQGHHRQQPQSADRAKPAQPVVHRGRARQGLGRRHHVHRH